MSKWVGASFEDLKQILLICKELNIKHEFIVQVHGFDTQLEIYTTINRMYHETTQERTRYVSNLKGTELQDIQHIIKAGGRTGIRDSMIPAILDKFEEMQQEINDEDSATPPPTIFWAKVKAPINDDINDYDMNDENSASPQPITKIRGIPIFVAFYLDCLNDIWANYTKRFLVQLLIHYAVRLDGTQTKELRHLQNNNEIRQRVIQINNKCNCSFLESVPKNGIYAQMFINCFKYVPNNPSFDVDIGDWDLRKYATEKQLRKRQYRKYIVFKDSWYIKRETIKQLFVLLYLLNEFITKGVPHGQPPPWYTHKERIDNKKQKVCVDLIDQ